MKHYYVIPFFISHKGCPHRCIFCDQEKISGSSAIDPGEVKNTIIKYLATIPEDAGSVEAGFFGGSFTALPEKMQRE